jgi:ribose transport system permease protein
MIVLRHTAYLSLTNFDGIIEQTTTITIEAIPTVFVIASGEIDLSFAAMVPVGAYTVALLLPHFGIIGAVLVALAIGGGVGFLNGFITVAFKMPSFVVTLGMMGVLNGVAQLMTNSATLSVTQSSFVGPFGSGSLGPIPSLALWTVGAVIIGYFVLNWTIAGKAVLATGANVNAARMSGIRTNRVKILALVMSGVGGSLAGVLYVGQYHSASFTLGSSDLLTAIAAVIIGGTALSGGKGSIIGALIGSLLIGTLNNGLIILGLAVPQQLIARGVIIIGAVMLSARSMSGDSGAGGLVAAWRRLTSIRGSQAADDKPAEQQKT